MPTRQRGCAAKKASTGSRRSLLRNRTAPEALAPCAWNTFLARSNPIVLTSVTDASLQGLLTPPLWHLDAVGGRPLHHWTRGGRHALVGRLVPHVQQPKAGCRLCRAGPYTVAKRISPSGARRLQGRQSPAANDHDPDRLAVAAASAAVSAGRVVPRADQAQGGPSRQDDARCSGAQAAGRALEVCDRWRSDRGGRPQASLIKMPPCPQSPGA